MSFYTRDTFTSKFYTWDDFKNDGVYGGEGQLNANMIKSLDDLTEKFGSKLTITSASRTPDYNAGVSFTGRRGSRHSHGDALDIDVSKMSDADRERLVSTAIGLGFRGIGTYDNGSIHLDTRTTTGKGPNGLSVWYGANQPYTSGPAWFRKAIDAAAGTAPAPVASGPQWAPNSVQELIYRKAKETGVLDPAAMIAIAAQESGFRTTLRNPNSTAFGVFQLLQDERKTSYGDSTDPVLQVTAGIEKSLRNHAAATKALGRAPTPGELYAVHYQGIGAGPAILRADRNKALYDVLAEGWGTGHADAVFRANPNFKRDGIVTVGDFLDWSEKKMAQRMKENGLTPGVDPERFVSGAPASAGGRSLLYPVPKFRASGEVNLTHGPSGVTYNDLTPPDPITPYDRLRMSREADLAAQKESYSLYEGAKRAFANETATGWFMRDRGLEYAPDPNFVPSRDLKEVMKDIPTQYLGNFGNAVSLKHAEKIRNDILEDLEYEKKMQAIGWKGYALKIGAAVVDPAGWLLAIAAGPVFGVGTKATRVGNALAGLMDGAATGALQQAYITANKPTDTWDSVIYAGLGGAVFGSAFGGAMRPRVIPEIQTAIRAAAKPAMKEIEDRASAGSVGAASAGNSGGLRAPVKMEAEDWLTIPEWEANWFDRMTDHLRFSFSGRFARSENPLTRELGPYLVEDAVGKRGKVNPFSVESQQKFIDNRYTLGVYQNYFASWKSYADEMGYSVLERNLGAKESEFRSKITDYILNTDPAATFPKQVAQAGEAIREMNKNYMSLANNPGLLDGTVRRSIPGFEDISNFNWKNYLMRQPDFFKFNDFIEKYGENALIRLVADSIIDGRLGVGKKLDAKISRKVAAQWVKTHRDIHAGQRIDMDRMWSGQDQEKLAKMLKDEAGLSDDEVKTFLDDLTADKKDPSGPARGKDRVFMNVNYVDPQTGMRVRDLLVDDALQLATHYSRQMSGQIAFARLRIKNPEFGKGGPTDGKEFLVDGLNSDVEWNEFLKTHQAVWDLVKPLDKTQAQKELKDLQFIRKLIMGIPLEEDGGNLALALRMVRKYNFARAMNQVGFSQASDLGNTLGFAGTRAFIDAMPAFKTLWRNAKTGKLDDELADELEYIFSPGTDVLRHFTNVRLDDFGSPFDATGSSKLVRGVDNVLDHATKVTQAISLMAPINTFMQRFTARAMAAKFVNAAKLGKEISENRLLSMGLDQKMASRIYDQINKHAKFTSQTESGRTLKILNTKNWDDQQARAAFENALFRVSRKLIQENDIGQLNRFLGSPIGKVMFQFRSFMLASWEKQFLYNIRLRDWNTLAMFMASSLFGALAYIGQTYLQSVGRSDQQEFLDTRLAPEKIGAAFIQRGAWASLFPMLVDNTRGWASMDPLFDTRASGLPSQGIFSNPTTNAFDNLYTFTRGITGALQGDDFTQREAKAGASLSLFQNFLPFQWVLNAMIADLPTRDSTNTR